MERYGRATDGSQSDPPPEWTATGPETGLEGKLKDSAFQFHCLFVRYPLLPGDCNSQIAVNVCEMYWVLIFHVFYGM